MPIACGNREDFKLNHVREDMNLGYSYLPYEVGRFFFPIWARGDRFQIMFTYILKQRKSIFTHLSPTYNIAHKFSKIIENFENEKTYQLFCYSYCFQEFQKYHRKAIDVWNFFQGAAKFLKR